MQRVILDLDLAMGAPGSDIDDGFALALALADPEIALDLVTTVHGNTDVASATALTLELLRLLGHAEIPVHRGAAVPLVRPQARFGSIPDDVEVREPQAVVAAVAMVEHVCSHPGEITLVAVGPLTNVALAMRLDPTFASSLKGLVIMGGVFNEHTNSASMPGEFNIWCDPDAAHIVLTSGVSARWVGLDVTLKVRVTKAEALAMEVRRYEQAEASLASGRGLPGRLSACPVEPTVAGGLSEKRAYVRRVGCARLVGDRACTGRRHGSGLATETHAGSG